MWAGLHPRLSPNLGHFAAHSSGYQMTRQLVSNVQKGLWAPLSSGRCWELTSLRGVEGSCPPSRTLGRADGPSTDGGWDGGWDHQPPCFLFLCYFFHLQLSFSPSQHSEFCLTHPLRQSSNSSNSPSQFSQAEGVLHLGSHSPLVKPHLHDLMYYSTLSICLFVSLPLDDELLIAHPLPTPFTTV